MEGEISSDFLVQNLVVKRKRSQRQRPFGANGNSSSSEDDIVDGRPMTTATFLSSLEEEEEEHQAAKCLMLLARDEYRTEFNSMRIGAKAEMLSATKKSWLEKKISGGLYECKTCNRTFQSFQALGGHQTSHKKMKTKTEELMPQKPVFKPSEQASNPIPPIALHLGTSRTAQNVRAHECLICGSVFASGQALGGHMRCHRVTPAINFPLEGETTTQTETKFNGITLSLLSPALIETEETGNETSRSNNDFQYLDLNLPASSSEEEEIGESQFCFGSKQPKEESGLVFSSPALDCHY